MIYYQALFNLKKIKEEEVHLLLAAQDILGLEEREESIIAYMDTKEKGDQVMEAVRERGWESGVTFSALAAQNWNETWESNFDPVYVDHFCQVVADFHEPKGGFKHTIHLQPKMAFGTGHHETTYMMIQQMSKMDLEGAQVLDFGCGSGILAILAEKMGAASVYGIDNDPRAISNAIGNGDRNQSRRIMWDCGELMSAEGMRFDVILANINRNVLLEAADKFHDFLNPDAELLLSGILDQDVQMILDTYADNGFALKKKVQRGEWWFLGVS